MWAYFESLPWTWGVLLVVTLYVIFTIVGILIVRRNVSIKSLKAHHDVAGVVFANLGVLYSVLLGFTAVNVQQRFDKIKETSQVEASYLAELYRDAEVFSDKERTEIRRTIKEYVASVINEEWKTMSSGSPNEKTIAALREIWQAYYSINLTNKKQEIWYAESVGKINQMMSARLARLLGGEEALGNEMWSFLILGSIVVVAFTWFFGLENLTAHLLMASIFAAATAFLLFLIYSLDSAFSGTVSIPPEAMERVAKYFAGG